MLVLREKEKGYDSLKNENVFKIINEFRFGFYLFWFKDIWVSFLIVFNLGLLVM